MLYAHIQMLPHRPPHIERYEPDSGRIPLRRHKKGRNAWWPWWSTVADLSPRSKTRRGKPKKLGKRHSYPRFYR